MLLSFAYDFIHRPLPVIMRRYYIILIFFLIGIKSYARDIAFEESDVQNDTIFIVEDIYFNFSDCELRNESYKILDSISLVINSLDVSMIEIIQYDFVSPEMSSHHADCRAKSIVKYLIDMGIDKSRVQSKGINNTGQEINSDFKQLISYDRRQWTIIHLIFSK